MLRLLLRRSLRRPPPWRRLLSDAPSTVSAINTTNSLPLSPSPPLQPFSPPPRRRGFPLLLSASLLSAAVGAALVSSSDRLDETMEKSRASVDRVLDRMGRTAAATVALWRSLSSVLSSVDHEVRSGFELRVAALLADIAAASEARRAAIVGAGVGLLWIGCWRVWRLEVEAGYRRRQRGHLRTWLLTQRLSGMCLVAQEA
ncbi:uncharacterized protein LOC120249328 [Dioscorea cayenensis subsp. rotundata]|uniref:Uncharacterized protein LOC120249328 n=1 Tax=Dioscorea cayennensis subsp. rotundata TaxID=55577 RepID=A0AB40AFS2_DIOCR|nr:uncharacterized protein LOC120249328 [Dioscorea cayenensis subsp. rotundata]